MNIDKAVNSAVIGSKALVSTVGAKASSTAQGFLDKSDEVLSDLDNLSMQKKVLINGRENTLPQLLKKIKERKKQTPATIDTLRGILTEKGYVQDEKGAFKYTLPKDLKSKIRKECGFEPSVKIINSFEKPLTQDDLENILKLINVDNSRYSELLTKDISQTASFYRFLHRPEGFDLFADFDSVTPAQWSSVMKVFEQKPSPEAINAIATYKSNIGFQINDTLALMKKDKNYTPQENIQKAIDNLTSYIDTQVIDIPLTIYRSEGYGVLDQFKLGGKKLGALMQKAAQEGDEKKINRILEILNAKKPEVSQARFISTSLDKDIAFGAFDGALHWQIIAPQGSKGVMIESANVLGRLNHEMEFLTQRNSKLKIDDITFKDGTWLIKATLLN